MTRERYGMDVTDRDAYIIDQLDEAFSEVDGYEITERAMLKLDHPAGHRSMRLKATDSLFSDPFLGKSACDAIRSAGLDITGVLAGIGEDNEIKVWIEPGHIPQKYK